MMKPIRPLGQTLSDTIKNIQDQGQQFSVTPINNRGDWERIYEPMVYASTDRISVSNTSVDLRNMFAVGDPLRIQQSGAYRYFWVTKVEATQITVKAGLEYLVSNLPITEISRGKKLNPIGFPINFTYSPNLHVNMGSISGITIILAEFYLVGNTVNLDLNAQFTIGGGGAGEVYQDIPAPGFNYGSGGLISVGNIYASGSTFTPQSGFGWFDSAGSFNEIGMAPFLDFFDGAGQAIIGKMSYKLA